MKVHFTDAVGDLTWCRRGVSEQMLTTTRASEVTCDNCLTGRQVTTSLYGLRGLPDGDAIASVIVGEMLGYDREEEIKLERLAAERRAAWEARQASL